jgi:hypothetical protein
MTMKKNKHIEASAAFYLSQRRAKRAARLFAQLCLSAGLGLNVANSDRDFVIICTTASRKECHRYSRPF